MNRSPAVFRVAALCVALSIPGIPSGRPVEFEPTSVFHVCDGAEPTRPNAPKNIFKFNEAVDPREKGRRDFELFETNGSVIRSKNAICILVEERVGIVRSWRGWLDSGHLEADTFEQARCLARILSFEHEVEGRDARVGLKNSKMRKGVTTLNPPETVQVIFGRQPRMLKSRIGALQGVFSSLGALVGGADGLLGEVGGYSGGDEGRQSSQGLYESAPGLSDGEPQVPFGQVRKTNLLAQIVLLNTMFFVGLGAAISFARSLGDRESVHIPWFAASAAGLVVTFWALGALLRGYVWLLW